jgi:hypothetical protein
VAGGYLTCTIETVLYLYITFCASGEAIRIPDKAPTVEELLDDPKSISSMTGWIIRTFPDRVNVTSKSGRQEV